MDLRGPLLCFFRWGLVIGFSLSLVVYFWLGFWCLLGWLGGLGVGAGAVLVTAAIVGRSLSRSEPPLAGVFQVLMIQGAKLPIFVLVIFFTKSMGYLPAWAFLSGYFLVYLALIAGAVGEASASSRTK